MAILVSSSRKLKSNALVNTAAEADMSVLRTSNVERVGAVKSSRVTVRVANHQTDLGIAGNAVVVEVNIFQRYPSGVLYRAVEPDHFFDGSVDKLGISSKSFQLIWVLQQRQNAGPNEMRGRCVPGGKYENRRAHYLGFGQITGDKMGVSQL